MSWRRRLGLNLCIRCVIISCSALILECGMYSLRSCRRGLLHKYLDLMCTRACACSTCPTFCFEKRRVFWQNQSPSRYSLLLCCSCCYYFSFSTKNSLSRARCDRHRSDQLPCCHRRFHRFRIPPRTRKNRSLRRLQTCPESIRFGRVILTGFSKRRRRRFYGRGRY